MSYLTTTSGIQCLNHSSSMLASSRVQQPSSLAPKRDMSTEDPTQLRLLFNLRRMTTVQRNIKGQEKVRELQK
jgi:hypothetical protein